MQIFNSANEANTVAAGEGRAEEVVQRKMT